MSNAGIGFANAVQAYSNVANGQAFGGGSAAKTKGPTENGEFASLVRSAIDEAIKIGEKSEQLSIQGVNDRADLNQVVTAVAEAEVTLQTVVAVRDKVIDSYKEILRMPI
jgi:flagellar hook-basal body complex protein FliE